MPPERHQQGGIRWLAAFGRFWWEFLVGDTPELFVGAATVLALVAVLVRAQHHSLRTVAAFVEPALVVVVLSMSLVLARHASRRRR